MGFLAKKDKEDYDDNKKRRREEDDFWGKTLLSHLYCEVIITFS